MKEAKKDLFKSMSEKEVDAICITTNGHWTLDGKAAMGGGCAGVCRETYPQTCENLGLLLKKNSPANVPFLIGAVGEDLKYKDHVQAVQDRNFKCLIFSFPTIDDFITGADLQLIHRSSVIMVQYANAYKMRRILVPRMGSGIGGLDWYREVKPLVEPILDDRFTIVCQEDDEWRE